MRAELEQGKLDGRLECPKCKTNVGKYAWQGMQCSCGDWVVPGISLAKSRIDEVKSNNPGTVSMGIRMPPSLGRRAGPGQQNL
jgi:dual specificity phosphatase 12